MTTVKRFTMFTDTDRPVYFEFDEMGLSDDPMYTDIPWLHSIEGLGDVHSTVLLTATARGSRSIGKSHPPRNLTVHLLFPPAWDPQNFRQQMYDTWNVDIHEQHTFRIEYGNHQYIERYIDGTIENVEADIFSKTPMIHISIVCPDPNWYMNPYAELYVDNEAHPATAGEPAWNGRRHIFNTTVETGFKIKILPGNPPLGSSASPSVGNAYIGVRVDCTMYLGKPNQQTRSFIFSDTLLAKPGNPIGAIRGGDVITIDTNPGSLRVRLLRGSNDYNLLPFTTMVNGMMRVVPTVQEYILTVSAASGSPTINGRATCKELYVGV